VEHSTRQWYRQIPAIDTFKARLHSFWSDQEVKYNWKSDIKTGSRSQVNVIVD